MAKERHLVVVAHPLETSLTLSLARAWAEALESLGRSCQIHDLYRMGFDPVLTPAELGESGPSHPGATDVARLQEDVRRADVLTVIYPYWWMAMPAILKGYIDRVFARGFAYEAEEGAVRGLLGGRKCVLITLSGAPVTTLAADGRWAAAATLQDRAVFQASGLELLDHLHFEEIAPGLAPEIVAKHLTRIRACARRLLPVD